MKKILFLLLLSVSICKAQVNAPIYTDTSGNVLNTPITLSNRWSMIPTASNANDIVSLKDITNSVIIFPIPIARGGTSTNTPLLVGTWSNSINFITLGTNQASAFQVGTILGKTFSQTNMSAVAGFSNVIGFTLGVVTTNYTIP